MMTKLTMLFAVVTLTLIFASTALIPAASSSAAANTVPAASALPASPPANPAEPHPHIRAALHELREAQSELKRAAHDFGGHREEALEATDKAIHQLEECLKYDKK